MSKLEGIQFFDEYSEPPVFEIEHSTLTGLQGPDRLVGELESGS